MTKTFSTNGKTETAVLIGVATRNQPVSQLDEYLDELQFLTDTAGAITLRRFTQNIEKPNPATYIGKGKLAEIAGYVKTHNVNLAIFDDELHAPQIRNIEKALNCRILDRTNLILDIFAKRARTARAKVQVELAQYKYLLPRLTRMWTHLEKQRGGIGLRGPGESEIETDRRAIRNKLARLKEKLDEIDRQSHSQRKNRGNMVRVALVGYTNVGKSTLMNLLAKTDVFAENKLFATLDTTVRKIVLENIPFLLTDTVGFIRKLPHDLVESFKSTLDEVREADIIVHVADISHPNFEEQIQVVNETLVELNAADKPTLMVFNKTDLFMKSHPSGFEMNGDSQAVFSLKEMQQSWMAKQNAPSIFISATQRKNIDGLREKLMERVKDLHFTRYPNEKTPGVF